jgi:hypothetical protein
LERCRLFVWANPKRALTPADQLAFERADSLICWDTTEWSHPVPDATVVCSVDPRSEPLRAHVERGGRAVVLEPDGRIVARARESERVVGETPRSGTPRANTLLLAVAANWVLRGDIAVVERSFASLWGTEEAT